MPGNTLPLDELQSAPAFTALSDTDKITVLNNWRTEVLDDNPDFKRPQRATINDAVDDSIRPLIGENRLQSILSAFGRGFQTAIQSRDLLQALGGDVSSENMRQFSDAIVTQRGSRPSPEFQRFQEAESKGEDPVDVLTEDAGNFVQIVTELTAESLGGFIPAMAVFGTTSTITGALIGAGVGAAAGSPGGAVGAGVGARSGMKIGARAGFNTGVGLASTTLEFTGKFIEILEEEGVDVTDPESLREAFQDKELIARANTKGLQRGVPVGFVDAVSAGLAGKLIGIAKRSGGSVAAASVVETLGQGLAGAGGDILGSISAGDPISKTSALSEFIGDVFGSGPIEIAAGVAFDARKTRGTQDEAISDQDARPTEPTAQPREEPLPGSTPDDDSRFRPPPEPPPVPAQVPEDARFQPTEAVPPVDFRVVGIDETVEGSLTPDAVRALSDEQLVEVARANNINFVEGVAIDKVLGDPKAVKELRNGLANEVENRTKTLPLLTEQDVQALPIEDVRSLSQELGIERVNDKLLAEANSQDLEGLRANLKAIVESRMFRENEELEVTVGGTKVSVSSRARPVAPPPVPDESAFDTSRQEEDVVQFPSSQSPVAETELRRNLPDEVVDKLTEEEKVNLLNDAAAMREFASQFELHEEVAGRDFTEPNSPAVLRTLSEKLDGNVVAKMTPEQRLQFANDPKALDALADDTAAQAEILSRGGEVIPPISTAPRITRTITKVEPPAAPETETPTDTQQAIQEDTPGVRPDQELEGVRLSTEQAPPLVDETGRVDPVSQPLGAEPTSTQRVEQELQEDGKSVTPRVNSLEDIVEQRRQESQEGSVLNPFARQQQQAPSEPNREELIKDLKKARNPIRRAVKALSDAFKFGKNRGGRSQAVNEAIIAGRTGREALNLIIAHHRRRGSKELRRLASNEQKKLMRSTSPDVLAAMEESERKAMGTRKVADDLNRAFEPESGFTFADFVDKYNLEENSSLRQVGERMLGLREVQESLVNSRALPEGVRLAIDETGYMSADGAPYQKTAYLRWILDDRDFLKVIREEDIILAKEEIRASINRTLDNMKAELQKMQPGETVTDSLDNRIRNYKHLISNYDNVYSSLDVIKNMDAIDNQVNDMFNYIMSPDSRKKSIEPGNGLPLPHIMHKHLEGAFKVLYQELSDPFIKALLTIDAVEHLAMQNAMLEVILEKDVSGIRNEEMGHTVQLEGRKFGTLDGKWTTPAVARAFKDPFEVGGEGFFAKAINASSRLYMNILGIERLAALLQAPTVARNFFSSYLGFAMAAGDFFRPEFWHAARLGGPIFKLMKGLKKKNNDPAAIAEFEQLVKEGILSPGSNTLLADMSAWSTTSLTEKTKSKFTSVIRAAGGAYAAIDYPAKLQALYGRIERETKALKKQNGGRDLTAAEKRTVRAKAVEHVKAHYQYRYATPEIAATLSRLPQSDFIGYRFDAARMKWNAATNAVREARGENPEGKPDLRPLTGLVASSAISLAAFEGFRRVATPLLAKLIGDEVDDEDIMADDQIKDLRVILPSYWREGVLNAYYDEDGKIILGYVNTYNPWPEEGVIAGAIQHGVQEGSTSVLLGSLATQYRDVLSFNMFMQTMADVFFDADLNDLRAGDFEGTLTYQFLSSLQNGEIEPDLFPKLKHEALGFMEDITPPFSTKTVSDLIQFKQREVVSGLPENVRGEIMVRTPEEILKANVSLIRWHTIDIPRAFSFGGNKKWQRVSTARSDLGSVINSAVKNQQSAFTKGQLDDANRALKKMRDRANDLADFLNAIRNVNRQLSEEEMRDTATDAELGGRISKTFYDEGVHAFITSYLDGKGVVYNVQNGDYFIERLLSPAEIKARDAQRRSARARTRSRAIRKGRVE